MISCTVDDVTVRLKAPHDLSFLARWGTAFWVLDDQDSGNLCFGVTGAQGRLFVKYAGAEPVRYEGVPADAISRAREAVRVYQTLDHPTLVRIREAVELDHGFAMIFDWTDSVPLGRQYGQSHRVRELSLQQRIDAVAQIYDFAGHAAALGWVAVDLYDGSVLVDLVTGAVTLCDLDSYEPAPIINRMGRMWGSTRFMAPEEFELGATIDQITNQVALGALAHTFLGDDATKDRDAWVGDEELFAIAGRALEADRNRRWPSVAALADAWRRASA